MSDGASLEVLGLADLMRELRRLPDAMQERVMKGTVATGASVIRRDAINRAPFYLPRDLMWGGRTQIVGRGHPPPGTLKRAIYQTRMVQECTQTMEVWKVDVHKGARTLRGGGKSGDRDAFYAHMVEYGTSKMSARPFMRPAFEAKKREALDAMQRYLNENLGYAVRAFRYIQAVS